ncbi:MAG: ArsR/SmtB family transcription factor [Planctomycetota bacterium JB042]
MGPDPPPDPPRRHSPDPSADLEALESVFAALSHASRRHVLLVLRARGGSLTAGEIAARFRCSWPTTTRHLRVLTEAGLVSVEARGRERVYRLREDRLVAVAGGWLRRFTDETPREPPPEIAPDPPSAL